MAIAFIDCLIYWANSLVTEKKCNLGRRIPVKDQAQIFFQVVTGKSYMEMKDFILETSFSPFTSVVANGILCVT